MISGEVNFLIPSSAVFDENGGIETSYDKGLDAASFHGTRDIRLPLLPRKSFHEAKVIMPVDNRPGASVDPKLVELLRDAAKARALVEGDPELPLHRLAERERRCRKQMTQLLKLSWLSPRIVDSIAAGDQPKGLTRQRLMVIDVPYRWQDQEALLGLA